MKNITYEQAKKLFEFLEPSLKKNKDKYVTQWGDKTEIGVINCLMNAVKG